MNKKFYLLGVMSFLATMMFAQGWVAPKITSADYAEVKLSSEAVGDTTIYYLYNIEGDGFLTNGVGTGCRTATDALFIRVKH